MEEKGNGVHRRPEVSLRYPVRKIVQTYFKLFDKFYINDFNIKIKCQKRSPILSFVAK